MTNFFATLLAKGTTMKKRFTAFLLLLLLVPAWLFPQGKRYPWKIGGESTLPLVDSEEICLTLEEGTLSPAGASFLLQNSSEETISFGAEYSIQIWIRGGWQDISLEDPSFWPLYTRLAAPGKHTLSIDWSTRYGPLPPGRYRLTIPLSSGSVCLCCKFTID